MRKAEEDKIRRLQELEDRASARPAAGGVEASEHEALTPPMTNWKGLAQFLFGKDWHLEDKAGEEGHLGTSISTHA